MSMNEAIMPGAEPFDFPGGPVGCLLVHGFSGNPSSLRPMGEYLAAQGFTVLGPRLKGHGTTVEEMLRCTYQDWLDSAESGLQELLGRCEIVFAAGLSMGATIVLHLACRHPGEIRGVIPICGPVFFKNFLISLLPLLRPFVKFIPGVGSDIKDPAVQELAYDKIPLPALLELVKLCRMVKKELPLIRQPALIFESREDHVVPPSNAEYIRQKLGSADKELVWLENSYHVATLDYDKELIFKRTAQFMRRLSQGGE